MNANLYETLRQHFAGALDRQFLTPRVGEPVTYAAIDERSSRFAAALRSLNVAPGDRVIVQVDKSIENVALYLAVLRVGAVFVPLNTAYVDHEVASFVEDAEPRLLVLQGRSINNEFGESCSIDDLSALATNSDPDDRVETRLGDDLAAMLYTSGTTGRSKGAMLTHANLTSNALSLHAIWRFTPGDVLLHILPIFHVHGLFVALHTAMLNASTILFHDRFEPEAVLADLPEATVMMGVPTHYVRLLAQSSFDENLCSSIRLFTSGSAPMTEAVHEEFTARTGHRILERYGMTEAGMITSNPYDGDRIAGTVGFPLPGVQVQIRDDEGELCGPEELGILEIRSPGLFSGYWRMEDKTEAEHRDGWFITGDVGSYDHEGRVTLEGRSNDMIISGGLNIYPKEIEQILDEIDGVGESAVVGVPNADFGESVVAVLAIQTDESSADPTPLTDDRLEASIHEALESQIARFKHPRSCYVMSALPRNAMGKIQKSELRRALADPAAS